MIQKEIELMAPAGNFETLIAAIKGGANSVYFGIEHLNMRAKSANNFRLAELIDVMDTLHTEGLKGYLALNTIIYDHELKLLNLILDKALEANVDAIIASDMAVINAARTRELSVHASTQLNISNIEAVKFFSKYCDTIVLARELTLKQTENIVKAVEKENLVGPSGKKIKIEIFAHGALCMAISGKCYLSLHEFNSSANRGACLQTCRRPYIIFDKETGYELEIDNEYIMSPKDLATLPFLDKILDTGVNILKIEGRARPPEYVKTTTFVYKQAIKSIQEGTFNKEKVENWMQELKKVFNRGFWDGYYLGRRLGEWTNSHGSQATHRKVFVGVVTNYYSKIKVAEVKLQSDSLELEQEIIITGNKTGIVESKIKEIRLNNVRVSRANKGDIISFPIDEKLRKNDKVYKWIKII